MWHQMLQDATVFPPLALALISAYSLARMMSRRARVGVRGPRGDRGVRRSS